VAVDVEEEAEGEDIVLLEDHMQEGMRKEALQNIAEAQVTKVVGRNMPDRDINPATSQVISQEGQTTGQEDRVTSPITNPHIDPIMAVTIEVIGEEEMDIEEQDGEQLQVGLLRVLEQQPLQHQLLPQPQYLAMDMEKDMHKATKKVMRSQQPQ
jgi:hypothetical protein